MAGLSRGSAIAVGAKSHVLYSRLLKADEYWALLNFNTVPEMAEFLKGTEGYGAYLETLPPSQVHRVDLEDAIRDSVLAEAKSFLYYLSGPRRKVFQDWLGWYEAEHLKSMFRWIRSRHVDRDAMRKRLYPVPGTRLSYDLLFNCRDYAEALEALRESKYYKVVREPVNRLIGGEESLFSFELAIDNLVESDLFNDLKLLPADEYKQLLPLIGSRIDMLNLYHFHRYMWYYHLPIEETLSRMLPVKYKVKTHHLRTMFNKAADWKERLDFLESMFPAYIAIFRAALERDDAELALEVLIKRFNYLKALSLFQHGSPGFHTAMSYFILKSHEIDDIIHIIEDVRYDADRRNAATYLIRPITSGGEPTWQ